MLKQRQSSEEVGTMGKLVGGECYKDYAPGN
jgi:hypothetical protein